MIGFPFFRSSIWDFWTRTNWAYDVAEHDLKTFWNPLTLLKWNLNSNYNNDAGSFSMNENSELTVCRFRNWHSDQYRSRYQYFHLVWSIYFVPVERTIINSMSETDTDRETFQCQNWDVDDRFARFHDLYNIIYCIWYIVLLIYTIYFSKPFLFPSLINNGVKS